MVYTCKMVHRMYSLSQYGKLVFFRQADNRIFWKFEFLFHEDTNKCSLTIPCLCWQFCLSKIIA